MKISNYESINKTKNKQMQKNYYFTKIILALFAVSFSTVLIGSASSYQNNFLKIEETDAYKLFEVQSLIFKERKFDEALLVLDTVFKNVPPDYGQICAQQKRFWDKADYQEYVEFMNDTSIPFILDAYSRLFYFYAVIHIERGNLEQAENYLLQGLKQIPNDPYLLCEMGMLYLQKYKMTLDDNNLDISSSYFFKVIEEQLYCPSGMMARALRGIGFNLIELGELDVAEEVFIASLEYEDNPVAYNELEYIELIRTENDSSLPKISTSTINSPDVNITSYTYLHEQMEKLPDDLKQIAEKNRYAYIFSKAASFLSKGAEQFRQDDYFNYPLKSWNEEKLISGCNQIVYYTRGLSPDYCLENMTESEFKNLFELFHFETSKIETVSSDNIVKGYFMHKMDKDQIVMYCRITKE